METFEGLKALAYYLMNFIPTSNITNRYKYVKNIDVIKYSYPIRKIRRPKNLTCSINNDNLLYLYFILFFNLLIL
jgi:hypothetical protein